MDPLPLSISNAEFWNELCGTSLAKSLGISDSSADSLRRYDSWYLRFYPYLIDWMRPHIRDGMEVLEVGLGYGTVAQWLMQSGARYNGLDIASEPVKMVKHRARQLGVSVSAEQGSILNAPFASERFDVVVAIGALHHTGDLQRSIEECRRLLKPHGKLLMMVYYSYSYRRFVTATTPTLRYGVREALGYRGVLGASTVSERAAYDSSSHGEAAPHTDWISKRSPRALTRGFAVFEPTLMNVGGELSRFGGRNWWLDSGLARTAGLDLYVVATK